MDRSKKIVITGGIIASFLLGSLVGALYMSVQNNELARAVNLYGSVVALGSKAPSGASAATETSFDPITAGDYSDQVTGLLSCGRSPSTGNCVATFKLVGGYTWSEEKACTAESNQIADCHIVNGQCGCETTTFSLTGGGIRGGVGTNVMPNPMDQIRKDPNLLK